MEEKFLLPQEFIEMYTKFEPKFGYNGLGYIVYKRTYSRTKTNGENEQ